MKLLFLIFIFALGVNAQNEQMGNMPKLMEELSKNYQKEISCVGQVFSDPTLGAKLAVNLRYFNFCEMGTFINYVT